MWDLAHHLLPYSFDVFVLDLFMWTFIQLEKDGFLGAHDCFSNLNIRSLCLAVELSPMT